MCAKCRYNWCHAYFSLLVEIQIPLLNIDQMFLFPTLLLGRALDFTGTTRQRQKKNISAEADDDIVMASQADKPKLKQKSGKAFCWKHFGVLESDETVAVCRLCDKHYSYKGKLSCQIQHRKWRVV